MATQESGLWVKEVRAAIAGRAMRRTSFFMTAIWSKIEIFLTYRSLTGRGRILPGVSEDLVDLLSFQLYAGV
jgi:hypothetical protein